MLNDKIIKSHIKSVVDQVNIPLIVSLKFVNIFENWQFVIFKGNIQFNLIDI